MTCQDVQRVLSDFLDGALEPAERTAVRAHLSSCEACRTVHGDLLRVRSAARTLGRLRARVGVDRLIGLLGDTNHSAALEGARALARIARDGGAVDVARSLYRKAEPERTAARAHLRAVDRDTARTIEDLWMRREVMQAEDGDVLSDDVTVARSSDESVAWDVLTRD